MIKLKKLLAGVLGAAMVMTSMTALADTAATTTPATIDETKKGSITIHKYTEGTETGSEGTETGSEGTGTTADKDNLKEDNKAIKDVGFTLYKVAVLDDLKSYYSTNPTSLPDAGDYYTGSGKDVTVELSKVLAKSSEKKTDAEGVANFTDLDLGIYLVVETTSPAMVTSPVTPFLISVPMTTVDGEDWLYDIHVYPKNSTAVGKVTLQKTGEDNALLAGVTFVLQKKNESDSWIEITNESTAQGDNTGDSLNLTTDSNGKISVENLSSGDYRFIETSVGDNYGYIMDGSSTYNFIVNGTDVTYDGKTDDNIIIPVTNEKPDLTKEVQDRAEATWGQDSDYNIGDTIPYQVTVDVPANITQLKKFEVTDTPTNLKDDVNSIALTCNGEVVKFDYTISPVDNGFKIIFPTSAMADYADKKIVISYNAVLQDTAVTTTTGNPNTASLEYSNAILPDGSDEDNPNEPGTPDTDIIKDNAVVYTFKLAVDKRANKEKGAPLKNVTFDLYKEVTEETADAVPGNTDNGLATEKYWLKIDTLKTDENGAASYSGLANGTYYLVETETADGFNLLKSPVKVELNIAYTTSMTETWNWDIIGDVKTLVKHEITASKTTFANTNDEDGKDGYITQTVVNKEGFTLPTTGGMGSIIFIVGGIALAMAGLLIILASSKKRTAK